MGGGTTTGDTARVLARDDSYGSVTLPEHVQHLLRVGLPLFVSTHTHNQNQN